MLAVWVRISLCVICGAFYCVCLQESACSENCNVEFQCDRSLAHESAGMSHSWTKMSHGFVVAVCDGGLDLQLLCAIVFPCAFGLIC